MSSTSPPLRAVLLGNAGAGKTTLSRRLIGARTDIARLSLDEIAWNPGVQRKPLAESLALLEAFMAAHAHWVIEGCYGDLIAAALPHATELHFLNPGVDVCVAHCRARPWEPEKFPDRAAQDQMLANLIEWVQTYPTRTDEFGLARHRELFNQFAGPKAEYVNDAQLGQAGALSFPSSPR